MADDAEIVEAEVEKLEIPEGCVLEEAEEAFAELAEVEEDEDEAPELDEEMQAAIAGGDAFADAEEDDQEEEVAEHLKDAIEGSMRMKRMLEQDEDDDSSAKKAKVASSPIQELVSKLLVKWSLQTDLVMKHVLSNFALEELKNLDTTGYQPDKFNTYKIPAELLARYVNECRERKGPGGGPLDVVSSFKFRWKLDLAQEKTLRSLNHKELRYVLSNYDGTRPIDEVVKEGKEHEPEEGITESAYSDGPGVTTIGRFGRLELIDAMADSAVFGDANLTFSLRLARHRKRMGHVGRVIATTFEDLPTLQERYKEVDESIKQLEELYAEVFHGVDCTRIALDTRLEGMEGSLGAVYYNYPHSGAVGGFFDGHPMVNWRHENLMRLFFRALRSFVKPGGIVKVASNMGAVGVRYSYIVDSASTNEFVHVETVPFLEWHLHRYGRSYGDRRDVYKRPDNVNNQSYNAQRAEADMVYCFCFAPSGNQLESQLIRMPPTMRTLAACPDGPFRSLGPEARKNLASQLRKRFVAEASGVHIG